MSLKGGSGCWSLIISMDDSEATTLEQVRMGRYAIALSSSAVIVINGKKRDDQERGRKYARPAPGQLP